MNTEHPDTQLATRETQLAAPSEIPSTGAMMAAVLRGNITEASVTVVERLAALQERQEARQAERDFAAAFARLQATMPQIVACKAVMNKDGQSVRYSFAPYEEIMTKARPALQECGFAITFDTDISEGRVIVTCTLMHISGHSRSNKFACRIGSGPPGANESQGDGAATTYAKRFALCSALNIVVETDNDGRNQGGSISAGQIAELRGLLKETKADEAKFLSVANAEKFEDIPESDYAALRDTLIRRRDKQQADKAKEMHPADQTF